METKNHHKITLQNTTLYQITCLAESFICLGMTSEKDTGKKLPTYLSIIGLRKMTTVTAPYADICAPNDKRKIADWLKFLLRITCAPHSRDTDKKKDENVFQTVAHDSPQGGSCGIPEINLGALCTFYSFPLDTRPFLANPIDTRQKEKRRNWIPISRM